MVKRMQPQGVDVVIIGAGIVGLALASLLQQSALRVAIVAEAPPEPSSLSEPPRPQVSAINLASERLLQRLGVWQTLMAQYTAPYHAMTFWEKESRSTLNFSAAAVGHPHLGHIIDNHLLRQILWHHVQQQGVLILAPDTPQSIVWGEQQAILTLNSGQLLTAQLVVGADGAHSWTRAHADIPITFYDYPQHALIATVKTAQHHQRCAWQCFDAECILAFLPLVHTHCCAIVWSVPPLEAKRLQRIMPTRFAHELNAAFERRLGDCSLLSERHVFPLRACYARSFAAHRLALIGDAAHTIHPLAGQGLNLGLADSVTLATELQRLQRAGQDIGEQVHLRVFERQRKYEAALLLAAMGGLQYFFSGQQPLRQWLRRAGLQIAERLNPLKAYLIHQANGLDRF